MNGVEYDYIKNLKHLKERYENEIIKINEELKDTIIAEYYEGLLDGFKTAIHDIEDMIDGVEI